MINLITLAMVAGLVLLSRITLGFFLPGWLWNVEHGRCSRVGILPIPASLCLERPGLPPAAALPEAL